MVADGAGRLGALLLGADDLRELLTQVAAHAGGQLLSFQLDSVEPTILDTTATCVAKVLWPYGERREVFGVSTSAVGVSAQPGVELFSDGERTAACWIYPKDPDLPALATVAYPPAAVELCNRFELFARPVSAGELRLEMVGYRPRRRALVRLSAFGEQVYAKVYRPNAVAQVARTQRLLRGAGLPVAEVLAETPDGLVVSAELHGTPLVDLLPDTSGVPAAALVELLDSLPPEVAALPRRTPWADTLDYHTRLVSDLLPEAAPRVELLRRRIAAGLDPSFGAEPTHGDFHTAQILVTSGRISGLLDPDTAGPGRRVDDLACLLAHLVTTRDPDPAAQRRLHQLISDWVPCFDRRVDPKELRLRTAAVVVSLSARPFMTPDTTWRQQIHWMLDAAGALVRQVA